MTSALRIGRDAVLWCSLVFFGSREVLMKYLTIAAAVAMIALLPGCRKERDAGPSAGQRVASNAAPVRVPEPGSLVLLASGATTLGGLLARRWYVMKKRAKRPERDEQ
jgi:hypothetical protein